MSTRDKLREDINYSPYCCSCNTMGRMTKTEKGFICSTMKRDHFNRGGCGYSFEFDEEFLIELNILGWDNAKPEREISASEMDEILRNVGILR